MNIYEDLKKTESKQPNIEFLEEVQQVEKEINEERIYERFFEIEKGDVVVDIGAHVGVFSKRALDKGASEVLSLEPDPMFFIELAHSHKVPSSQFRRFNLAIGSFNGPSVIKSDGHANTIGSGDVDIHVSTFYSFIEDYGIKKIDFLKVDCEGGEYDIFTKENITWIANNCKKIAIEFHLHNNNHREEIVNIFNRFDEHGIDFTVTSLDGINIGKDFNRKYFTEVLVYATTKGYKKGLYSFEGNEKAIHHFVDGPYVELFSDIPHKYNIILSDQKGKQVFSSIVPNRGWVKGYHQYFIPYNIKIIDVTIGDKEVYNHNINLEGKTVCIELLSGAMGDTLAWMPYIEEFRKVHNCNIFAVTFHNYLFRNLYQDINFIEPATVLQNVYAWYRIGWNYTEEGKINKYKNPVDPRGEPLQKTASDILGLKHKEVKAEIGFIPMGRPIQDKYVCIANHATSQAKYWNYPQGWQKVVDHLTEKGYKVVLLSREKDGHNGNINPTGVIYPKNHDIYTIMNYLHYSEYFIGIGSGLSWLSWSLGKPTVLISGFSEPYTEMDSCIRIFQESESICRGCFNWIRLQDDGDWNWCPRHKGTERAYECTKNITPDMVIKQLPL